MLNVCVVLCSHPNFIGKTVTNVEKFKDVVYVNEEFVSTHTSKREFVKSEKVGDGFYEITNNKRRVLHHLPTAIGFFVYNYAKKKMLELYYDMMGE